MWKGNGAEMESVKEWAKGKDIVIWGIGPLQYDLEAFYPFLKPLFYIDDHIQKKNGICILPGNVYSSWKLGDENIKRKNFMIIICGEPEYAVTRLKELGYGDESYMLGEELLADISLYQQICENEFSIWGMGDTYYRREKDIHEYLCKIRNFIVTEKAEERFQGRRVLSKAEAKDKISDTYIVVTSIYYKEIYEDLMKMGLEPGKDFAHVDTLILLGKMSRMAEAVYEMDDRRKGSGELAVILAGYKEFVWDSVFVRLKTYIPSDMDICIVSSGLVNSKLREMCAEYGWSYMSTERNNVSLALNLAIWKHPKAEYIYKLDEDIFTTDGVFETVRAAYEDAEKRGRYQVGFATPLIPINGYGIVRLLEILDKVELWEERFGILKYNIGTIYGNPEAARFMWELGSLDDIQKILKEKEFHYSACPVKYSIGFILFKRKIWREMGMFPMLKHKNIGSDEDYLCSYCMDSGMVIMVAENAVAGHLSYGPQNREMEKYYHEHKEVFCLRK